MKKLIVKHGLYASLVVVGIPLLMWTLTDGEPNYDLGEIIGYATMVLCMTFVFLGIREYRNHELNGSISFGQALKVGVLIALIPSVAFGVYDLIYVIWLDPDFYDTYYAQYIEEMKNTMPESELEKALADMEAQKELFMNPFMQFLVMFLTVFLIGFVISLISSMVLKRAEA